MPAVLFVSHDPDLRAVACRVLIGAGHDVTTAAHAGHASLACMERGPFEVLVIEDLMGDGAGAAIASRLRRYCPALQVVRMCNATPATSLDGITVVRPFTADDLVEAVTAATAYALRGATTR